jgi:hypothetical protein
MPVRRVLLSELARVYPPIKALVILRCAFDIPPRLRIAVKNENVGVLARTGIRQHASYHPDLKPLLACYSPRRMLDHGESS